MKNVMLNASRLLSVVFIAVLVFASVSCGDDDNGISCAKTAVEFSSLYADLYDANCAEFDALSNKVIETLRDGKSCDFVDDLIESYEVANFDALVDALESEMADIKANACTPA
jgi:hypothetical protein